MQDASAQIIQDQIAYYRARANEYDEWFLRQGRYDHGPEWRQQWLAEVHEVQHALDAFGPRGNLLELAAGTGWWTEQLARHADRITAVDAAAETIAINRARLARPKVDYVQADLFQWTPPSAAFDVVFFSFWLSHVPPELFERFWDMVRVALSPGGRVFFVDSLYAPDSSAQDHTDRSPQRVLEQRKLNDGRTFQIVKMYYRPQELATRLAALGWQPDVSATATYFLHGACRR